MSAVEVPKKILEYVALSFKSLFPGGTIFNIALVITTFGGEQFLRQFSFQCPCAVPQNRLYGLAFLVAPSLAFLIAGILVNQTTWRILQGCCYRTRSTRHGLRRASYYVVEVVAQALVAPCAWLFIALLNGGYYECYRADEFCRVPPVERTEHQQREIESSPYGNGEVEPSCVCQLNVTRPLDSRYLRSVSQVYAWSLLMLVCSVVLVYMCVSKWFDRYTYTQNFYVNLYRKVEQEQFEKEAKERATRRAHINSMRFFDKTQRTKLDWDKVSVVAQSQRRLMLCRPRQLSGDIVDAYLTPLDNWCKESYLAEQVWHGAVETAFQADPQLKCYYDSDDTNTSHVSQHARDGQKKTKKKNKDRGTDDDGKRKKDKGNDDEDEKDKRKSDGGNTKKQLASALRKVLRRNRSDTQDRDADAVAADYDAYDYGDDCTAAGGSDDFDAGDFDMGGGLESLVVRAPEGSRNKRLLGGSTPGQLPGGSHVADSVRPDPEMVIDRSDAPTQSHQPALTRAAQLDDLDRRLPKGVKRL